jgi:peroxidase
MFAAGDPRVAENPALTSLQTLFVREHNFQVDKLHTEHPNWSGDQLYNHARAIVSAEIANITYSEFLPNLLGADALKPYAGYDAGVDPHLTLEFAGAAFRFGHSIVSGETEGLAENGEVIEGSEDNLQDVFFQPPANFTDHGGADAQLRHLAADPSQALDSRIVEDLRNFLVDPPAAMDLAAINIMRSRDLGIGTLNQTREALGLDPYTDFAQITDDPITRAGLQAAYGNVNNVGLWTGGLSENHISGALVGETFLTIMSMQFEALRDGDRFWFENQGFDSKTLAEIKDTTLADIILRNTDTQHIQDDVFVTYARHTGLAGGVASEDPDARQLVIGSNGGDTLIGGPQNDYLFAGTGKQILSGLEGADKFVIARGATQAKITDFEPGVDKIVFADAGHLDWHDTKIKFDQGNTIVSLGNDRIELVGVNPYELSRYDFLFEK